MSNMQEYDFQALFNKWRSLTELDKDDRDSTIVRKKSNFTKSRSKNSMASSSSQYCLRRNREELDSILPVTTLQASSSATSTDLDPAIASEPSFELIKLDNGGEKVATGDSCNKEDEAAVISVNDIDTEANTTQPRRANNEANGDNVDSVFLRASPTAHPSRLIASKSEDNCATNCLHYTLQCSDCVIM